jgi:hypothetical protein
MSRAVPMPGDMVGPGMDPGKMNALEVGEIQAVNEKVFQAQETDRVEVVPGVKSRIAPVNANTAAPEGRVSTVEYVFIVPDARPFLTVPLDGPGVYQLTVKHTVEGE